MMFSPAAIANGNSRTHPSSPLYPYTTLFRSGVDTDQSPNTITVNVTPVNDAPAGTNNTVTTLEDTAYALKTADFGFTDHIGSADNAIQVIEITSLPTAGTLTDNCIAVTAGQF